MDRIDLTRPGRYSASEEQGKKRFTAANALIRHLMLCDEERFDFRIEALETMSCVFEQPLKELTDKRAQSADTRCPIPAGVELIEIISHKIYRWCYGSKDVRNSGDEESPGPLWNGQCGFSLKHWEFWQRRFFELSGEVSLTAEHFQGARKAAETMSRIEHERSHVEAYRATGQLFA